MFHSYSTSYRTTRDVTSAGGSGGFEIDDGSLRCLLHTQIASKAASSQSLNRTETMTRCTGLSFEFLGYLNPCRYSKHPEA